MCVFFYNNLLTWPPTMVIRRRKWCTCLGALRYKQWICLFYCDVYWNEKLDRCTLICKYVMYNGICAKILLYTHNDIILCIYYRKDKEDERPSSPLFRIKKIKKYIPIYNNIYIETVYYTKFKIKNPESCVRIYYSGFSSHQTGYSINIMRFSYLFIWKWF